MLLPCSQAARLAGKLLLYEGNTVPRQNMMKLIQKTQGSQHEQHFNQVR